MAKHFGFLNESSATEGRLVKPVRDIPPLLEVNILRACRQTYREGTYVLYTMNTFAVTIVNSYSTTLIDCGFSARFPNGVDRSRIQHLRIELQFDDLGRYRPGAFRDKTWSSFCKMRDLRNLQFVVTFRSERGDTAAYAYAGLFNRCWQVTNVYSNTMRDVIASIPKEVENVKWGLTKAQKETGDYGGYHFAKGCVLRKIYKTYEGLRGTDVDMMDERPDFSRNIDHLPVNGDGHDSDEEKEGADGA